MDKKQKILRKLHRKRPNTFINILPILHKPRYPNLFWRTFRNPRKIRNLWKMRKIPISAKNQNRTRDFSRPNYFRVLPKIKNCSKRQKLTKQTYSNVFTLDGKRQLPSRQRFLDMVPKRQTHHSSRYPRFTTKQKPWSHFWKCHWHTKNCHGNHKIPKTSFSRRPCKRRFCTFRPGNRT